jgi:hypothetical protein
MELDCFESENYFKLKSVAGFIKEPNLYLSKGKSTFVSEKLVKLFPSYRNKPLLLVPTQIFPILSSKIDQTD